MVNEATGRLFRRKDGKYMIYLPKDLCEDSMFPFKDLLKPSPRVKSGLSVQVNVAFSTAKKLSPICLIITPTIPTQTN
jgi:hypothetical protein